MTYNLLREKWLPVIRKDGSHDRIAPWEITDGNSPIIDLMPPRADFRAALLEFLIGLMQTAYAPEQEKDWRELLKKPPLNKDLKAAMQAHEPYFNLLGDHPRFMQDLIMSNADKPSENGIAALLMDSPGANTLKQNTDFFVKRGRVDSLCPSCAAMALFTLQAFAPSGGKGHRTSLRGGGPLSTLVQGKTLWEKIWSNVLPVSFKNVTVAPEGDLLKGNVYPWAAPTKTSEKGEETHPEDVHFLHAYWGMPRRIILKDSSSNEPCSLCGNESETGVATYLTRPSGYNYGPTWIHPLTPYRFQTGNSPLSIKGQSNISGYNHWLGLAYGQPETFGSKNQSSVQPALCVAHARNNLDDVCINVAGFDMDNMKPLQWCEHTFPVFKTEDNDLFRETVDSMVQAASKIRSNLVVAIKDALVNEAGKNQAKVDKSFFTNASNAFWGNTESRFYCLAAKLAKVVEYDESVALLEDWGTHIQTVANNLFHEHVMSLQIPPERFERYVEAGSKMRKFNYSYLIKAGLLIKGDSK